MPKPIAGTWFEFSHHNKPEGKYWNSAVRDFSDAQWEEKVGEIASLGMKYIVLMGSSLVYENECGAYFKTDIYPFADMAAEDPIGALLRAAERYDRKVFVSCGFYGPWTQTKENMISPDVRSRAFRAMEQLYDLYGHYRSFYGWYLPDELGINPYFTEEFIRYVNDYAAFGKSIRSSLKVLIAPYGTRRVIADEKYVAQLEAMDCDYIAYQDEVGVQKSVPEETAGYYEALRKAHDKAGRSALWADMEVFEFEGPVYESALLPADFSRVRAAGSAHIARRSSRRRSRRIRARLRRSRRRRGLRRWRSRRSCGRTC